MSQYALGLSCVNCGAHFPLEAMFEGCPACRSDEFLSSLTVAYDYDAIRKNLNWSELSGNGQGIWRYRELLPLSNRSHEVTLNEGNTPLVAYPQWARELGLAAVYLKDESRNPTWSFKDRLCAVAVSKALDFEVSAVAVSTSGNHGASTAAYAARAGLACVIFTYPGISQTMSFLMHMYGAYLFVTTFEGRWQLLKEGMRRYHWYPTGNITNIPSCNPYGHEGYKTMAYEIYEQQHRQIPDVVIMPSGYSEGLYGMWKGFKELQYLGVIDRTPRMVAVEPEQRAALNKAHAEGKNGIATMEVGPTAARGIGSRINSYIGYKAVEESGGVTVTVSDEEILDSQAAIARSGIYVEPASATSVAGLRKLVKMDELSGDQVVICISTSSGLKGPEVPKERLPPPVEIESRFSALLEASSQFYKLSEGSPPFAIPSHNRN